VVVKIPVPTTLLINRHVAVNPLIRREFSRGTVFLGESSVKFFSNEKPVFHLSGPHGKSLSGRAPVRSWESLCTLDVGHKESILIAFQMDPR
jgi:hypothetical protein